MSAQKKLNTHHTVKHLFLLASLVTLAITNPRDPDRYIREVSRQAHGIWCNQPQNEWCEFVSPITRPVIPWVLKATTQTENYIFFTFSHTRLPCVDIFGVGIVGQQIIWPVSDRDTDICDF